MIENGESKTHTTGKTHTHTKYKKKPKNTDCMSFCFSHPSVMTLPAVQANGRISLFQTIDRVAHLRFGPGLVLRVG